MFTYFRTGQNWVNFAKLQTAENQNVFQNILKLKAVQNRPQRREVRQFYICIPNYFMTIQNRVYRPFKFFVLWYSLHISEMTAGLTWL